MCDVNVDYDILLFDRNVGNLYFFVLVRNFFVERCLLGGILFEF